MFSNEFIGMIAEQTATVIRKQVAKESLPRLMKTKEAATYLGMTETALRQRRSNGQIPESVTSKIGGSIYYDRKKLDVWLDEIVR